MKPRPVSPRRPVLNGSRSSIGISCVGGQRGRSRVETGGSLTLSAGCSYENPFSHGHRAFRPEGADESSRGWSEAEPPETGPNIHESPVRATELIPFQSRAVQVLAPAVIIRDSKRKSSTQSRTTWPSNDAADSVADPKPAALGVDRSSDRLASRPLSRCAETDRANSRPGCWKTGTRRAPVFTPTEHRRETPSRLDGPPTEEEDRVVRGSHRPDGMARERPTSPRPCGIGWDRYGPPRRSFVPLWLWSPRPTARGRHPGSGRVGAKSLSGSTRRPGRRIHTTTTRASLRARGVPANRPIEKIGRTPFLQRRMRLF